MSDYTKIADELDRLHNNLSDAEARCEAYRKALEVYAIKENWFSHVHDSYSGECWDFDWDGDLMDEPWDVAEQALNHKQDCNPCIGKDKCGDWDICGRKAKEVSN